MGEVELSFDNWQHLYEYLISNTESIKRHVDGYWVLYNQDASVNSFAGDEFLAALLDIKIDRIERKEKPRQVKPWYRKERW